MLCRRTWSKLVKKTLIITLTYKLFSNGNIELYKGKKEELLELIYNATGEPIYQENDISIYGFRTHQMDEKVIKIK